MALGSISAAQSTPTQAFTAQRTERPRESGSDERERRQVETGAPSSNDVTLSREARQLQDQSGLQGSQTVRSAEAADDARREAEQEARDRENRQPQQVSSQSVAQALTAYQQVSLV